MPKLVYQAASHHKLFERGQIIHGGEQFEVSADRAHELLADPTLSVAEVMESLEQLKRGELNQLARDAGVAHPEELPNKAAVIAALDPSPESQPEAVSGEGPDKKQEA